MPGRLGRFFRHVNTGLILTVVAAGAGLLLSPSDDDGLLGLPKLEVGQVAPRTIKSPSDFAIPDQATEERLRREAASRVPPTYDLVGGHGLDAKRRIEAAFTAASPPAPAGDAPGAAAPAPVQPPNTTQELMRALRVYFDDKELDAIVRAGFTDEFRDAAISIARTIYERRITEDRELLEIQAPEGIQVRVIAPDGTVEREESVLQYGEIAGLDQARALADEMVAARLQHLPPQTRRATALLVKRLLQPNLLPNPAETERRAEAARRAIKPLFIPIKSGEVVLREGEPVTARDLLTLEGIAGELAARNRMRTRAGGAALIVLLLGASFFFHRRMRRAFLPDQRDVAFFATVYVLTLLLLYGGYNGANSLAEEWPLFDVSAYRYLVPVAWGALVLRFVVGVEATLAFLPLAALTAGWVMDKSIGYAVYALVGGLAVAALRDTSRPRVTLVYAGLRAGILQAAVIVLLAVHNHEAEINGSVAGEAALAFVSGVLAAGTISLIVPALEVLFGYNTSFKLGELANLNHPLLRDLLVQAPGAYHHSIVVGALAEAAARATGADPLLARVAGYYHDIGKLKNPRLYLENNRQTPGHVPGAEEMTGLRMHVAEGLELGAKHRLGRQVLEIIAQHHGTAMVRVAQMRLIDPGSATLPPADLSMLHYAGPKPLTKEAGLVMLADCVEAAIGSRVLEAPLEDGELEDTVRTVIREVVNEGQLEDSDLSFREIKIAGEEFVVVLREMLLRRGRPPSPELASDPRFVRPTIIDPRPN